MRGAAVQEQLCEAPAHFEDERLALRVRRKVIELAFEPTIAVSTPTVMPQRSPEGPIALASGTTVGGTTVPH